MIRSLARCLLLVMVVAPAARAQDAREQRIVTLMPDYAENWIAGQNAAGNPQTLRVSNQVGGTPAASAYLRFPADALPDDAKIVSARLRLVRSGDQPQNPELVMRVASIACTGAPPCNPRDYQLAALNTGGPAVRLTSAAVDLRRFPQRAVDVSTWTPPDPNPGLVRRAPDGRKYIALLLVPEDSGSGRIYYWAQPGNASADPSRIPRLIVTYSIASAAPALTGVQTDGTANVRSARAFLPPATLPRAPAYLPRDVDGENLTHAPASYNGLLYLVQARSQGERYLDALTPLGAIVWSVELPADLQGGTFVVANNSGRLAIVGKSVVLVTQLNAADATRPPAIPAPAPPDVAKLLNNPSAVMAGPDGSLYVVNELSLFALNPDLRLMWRAGGGASDKARLTLSPDGRFLYATEIRDDKAALLAINAQTGRTVESAFPSATRAFHAPVVVRHPGGADYVFVGANTANTGVLRCVMNDSTLQRPAVDETGDTTARLRPCSGWTDVTGLVGQPMLESTIPAPNQDLSGKKLFAVVGTKLMAIQPQSGATLNTWNLPDLPAATLHLWSGGSPVIDADDNLLFWENGRLYGLSTRGPSNTVFSTPVSGLPADVQLSFGPGGALYASGVSDYKVRALVPRYQLPLAGTGSEISSPTNVQIDGASGDKKWVVTAEGAVIVGADFTVGPGAALSVTSRGVAFRPGFSVKQGATLTITSKGQ